MFMIYLTLNITVLKLQAKFSGKSKRHLGEYLQIPLRFFQFQVYHRYTFLLILMSISGIDTLSRYSNLSGTFEMGLVPVHSFLSSLQENIIFRISMTEVVKRVRVSSVERGGGQRDRVRLRRERDRKKRGENVRDERNQKFVFNFSGTVLFYSVSPHTLLETCAVSQTIFYIINTALPAARHCETSDYILFSMHTRVPMRVSYFSLYIIKAACRKFVFFSDETRNRGLGKREKERERKRNREGEILYDKVKAEV